MEVRVGHLTGKTVCSPSVELLRKNELPELSYLVPGCLGKKGRVSSVGPLSLGETGRVSSVGPLSLGERKG